MSLFSLRNRLAPAEWRIALTVFFIQAVYIKPFMHEGQRQYEQAESILIDHSLSIDEVLIRGSELDPSRRRPEGFITPSQLRYSGERVGLDADRAFSRGHYYPGVAPGLTLLYLPALAVLVKVAAVWAPPLSIPRDLFLGLVSLWLAFVVMVPITIATALCVYRVNRRLVGEGPSAIVLTLLYAFGTISLFYGTFVNAWQVINLCTWIVLFLGLTRAGPLGGSTIWLLGLVSAISISINYGAIFLSFLFAAWVVARFGPKAAALFGAGFVVGIVPLLVYHQFVFGTSLTTAYSHRVDQTVVNIMAHGFEGYGFPSLAIMAQLLISPRYGILFYMPILALAIWARPIGRERIPFWLGVSGMALVLLLNGARRWDWRAGEGTFGPRYFVQALPFMWLLIVCGFKRAPIFWQVLLSLVSILINWAGVQYGTNFVYVSVSQLLLHGHEIPAQKWAQRMFFAYTDRRPPTGASGIIVIVAACLAFIWAGPQILAFLKERLSPSMTSGED
jgi:hypothetical protein